MAQKPQRERTTTSTTLPGQNSTDSTTTAKSTVLSRFIPKSNLGRLGVGMLILFVGMQVLEYLLFFVEVKFNVNLNAPLGKSVPILGSLSWFMFIWLLLIFALYFALLRFGIIPNGKTMRAQRAAAATARTAPASTTTHAERKRAARHAATTTATTVSTARRTATTARLKSGQTVAAKAGATSATGISDDVYDRVKAAQRQRRRRDGKR